MNAFKKNMLILYRIIRGCLGFDGDITYSRSDLSFRLFSLKNKRKTEMPNQYQLLRN